MAAAVALHVGVSVMDVADACHDAVERFLRIAPTSSDLTSWLRGAYRRATSFVPQALRSLSTREQSMGDADVADVVSLAQCAVRQAIAAALCPGAEGLARSLPDALHLSVVTDAYGGSGFAAVDVPTACLADRVLSLIVAEYLTRPEEFIESAEAIPLRAVSSGKFAVASGGEERFETTLRGPSRRA